MSLFEAAQLSLIFGLLVFNAQPTVMYTIFSFLTGLIGSLLLLRAWCWTLAITPRDPVVGFIWKATNWLVTPFGFVVRPRGNWDLPTLAATVFVALVQVWAGRELMGMPETATAFIVAIIAMTLRWLVNLLIWGTIIYCILSFLPTAGRATWRFWAHCLIRSCAHFAGFCRPSRDLTFHRFCFSCF